MQMNNLLLAMIFRSYDTIALFLGIGDRTAMSSSLLMRALVYPVSLCNHQFKHPFSLQTAQNALLTWKTFSPGEKLEGGGTFFTSGRDQYSNSS